MGVAGTPSAPARIVMSYTIRHFMWGYQRHFCIGQKVRAEGLLQLLDEDLDPEVFLVGILTAEEAKGRFPACVDPEDEFWIESEAFNVVKPQAVESAKTYEEASLMHSHPLAQQWHDEGLFKRAVREEILEVVRAKAPEGRVFFASWPVPVEGYLVSLVLGLEEQRVLRCPRLDSVEVPLHELRKIHVPVSILEASIDAFLEDVSSELCKPNASAGPSGKSADELLRAGAQRFMTGLARRSDTFDNQLGHDTMLFDSCNRIAAMKYERAVGRGRAYIARREHPRLSPTVTFETPVAVRNQRASRKILELASRDAALHMNAQDIWGLVQVRSDNAAPNPPEEDIFEVSFTDLHQWEVSTSGTRLMTVRDGMPSIPQPPFDSAALKAELRVVFGEALDGRDTERLASLVEAATEEEHGTILVISSQAAKEAKRLGKQCTPIVPVKADAALIRRVTPIDGAVLVDPNGICHAIGVILDGLATERGDPARGARFNSAVRYVSTRDEPCMAIVISEDGGVDVFPEPSVSLVSPGVEGRLQELRAMINHGRVNRRRYTDIMDWLSGRSARLLKVHHEELESIVPTIDDLLESSHPGFPRVTWRWSSHDDE